MGTEFGKYLNELRKDRNLTLRDVEKQAKISNAYLSQVERGERGIPTMRILSKLAEVYGVPVSDLSKKAETEIKKSALQSGMIAYIKSGEGKKQGSLLGNAKNIPAPDVEFICRGYESLSEDNKQMLKRFLTTLQNEDKGKS